MSLNFYLEKVMPCSVFDWNITHNFVEMAEEAGIYKVLWRPDENGFELARELIEPLKHGLELLKSKPDHFKKFNPDNGWGCYENLVEFVEAAIKACNEYPEATIRISR